MDDRKRGYKMDKQPLAGNTSGIPKKQPKVDLEELFWMLDDKGFSSKNQAQHIMVARLQNESQWPPSWYSCQCSPTLSRTDLCNQWPTWQWLWVISKAGLLLSSLEITHSGGSQTPCQEDTQAALWRKSRNWGLLPTGALTSQTSEWASLKADPPAPVKPSHDYTLGWHLDSNLIRPWVRTKLTSFVFHTHRNHMR